MKKVVFVVHCMLNTNSMVKGVTRLKKYPGSIDDVLKVLIKNKVGIIQLQCPEKKVLGLLREKDTKTDLLKNQALIKECQRIAKDLVKEIKDYQKDGCQIAFILGQRGSPTCGVVETHIKKDGQSLCVKGSGILFDIIEKKLGEEGLRIPLIDFEHEQVEECLNIIKRLLNSNQS